MAKKTTPTVVETDEILVQARKQYEAAREWWNDNHIEAKDDLEFARLDKQWPEAIKEQRGREGKPCESYNKMPTFIRQVVNDARQNKPSIKVHPQDSGSDPHTAEILNGLIRNIEVTSDADIATDTAIEHAVGQGFGFWRINTAYTTDDAFEQDIVIERVMNPFTVYGDPRSTAADSSDWNVAFVVTTMTKDEFEAEYPDAEKTDWEADFRAAAGWIDGDNVIVAEWWTREKVKGAIIALSDGSVMKLEEYQEKEQELAAAGIGMVGEPREVESFKVTQRIMSGAEVLKTVEWAGKYIPIVPVYGDEVVDKDGKRHFRSLIRDAKGEQRTYNYMRNTALEALALQPRVPFIGEEKAFSLDPNWNTANKASHPYLIIPDGATPPVRQPLPTHFSAAAQEALMASDGMKSIIGIYDASLGARSNETSGKAIMARQREGDVSTFHFIDNLSRAIRHGGRILLDLIPKVYSTERMIRILGEDLKPASVQLAPGQQPQPQMDGLKVVGGVFDLTAGKYDLTVAAGPSYTSRREEARAELVEVTRAVPEAAATLLPMYLRNSDWPGAEEAADKLEGGAEGPQIPPEMQEQMQQMQQMIQQGGQELQRLEQELAAAKADQQGKQAEIGLKQQEMALQVQIKQAELEIKQKEFAIKAAELEIKRFEAETDRIQAMKPEPNPEPPSDRAAA